MLNRLKLTFLAALAFYFNSWNLAAQQMPDVSITKNNWQLDPGVTTTNQGLIIINGDPERYVKAQLTKNVPTVKDLYFIADVKLENVETGEEAFAHPSYKTAAMLFDQLVTSVGFEEFLTLPAYDALS